MNALTSFQQGILPGGCVIPRRDIEKIREVKETWRDSILALPGVNGVGIGDGLLIHTETAAEATLLKGLLRDEIDGVPVRIQAVGRISAQAARSSDDEATSDLVDPKRALEKYAPALKRLPGVSGVEVQKRSVGRMTPAMQDQIVVYVSRPMFVRYRNLVRDRVDGVRVSFEPQSCWGRPTASS